MCTGMRKQSFSLMIFAKRQGLRFPCSMVIRMLITSSWNPEDRLCNVQTLKRKLMMSPSRTTYSLPSRRSFPAALAAALVPPQAMNSS